MKVWQRYAAEALGTFILVGVGTGSILAVQFAGEPSLLVVSLAFGLAFATALYTVGRVSGGHFNPALSLGAFLDRRIGLIDMLWYWIAQISGALVASLAFLWILDADAVASTYTQINRAAVNEAGGFIAEAVFTMVFVMAVLALGKSRAHIKYLGMGMALSAIHLVGLVFTGASVNPARSFAPALVGNTWDGFWLYVLGPAAGAVLGWVLYRVVVLGDTDFSDDAEEIAGAVITEA
jgi:MIP family channel proteins